MWGSYQNICGSWATRQSWSGSGTWDITHLSTPHCTVASIPSLAFITVMFRIMTINTRTRYIFQSKRRSFRKNLIDFIKASKNVKFYLLHVSLTILHEKCHKNHLGFCTIYEDDKTRERRLLYEYLRRANRLVQYKLVNTWLKTLFPYQFSLFFYFIELISLVSKLTQWFCLSFYSSFLIIYI